MGDTKIEIIILFYFHKHYNKIHNKMISTYFQQTEKKVLHKFTTILTTYNEIYSIVFQNRKSVLIVIITFMFYHQS